MDERTAFQTRRLALLSAAIDVSPLTGLEIGALDLPTVPKDVGKCRYADFRTADQMIGMWDLPAGSVCHVDYVLSRDRSILERIPDRFDYIVACHVLEHVPDVISYLNDLRSLLLPGPNKVIFVTLPDKRATLDRTRPSTTVERLLTYHYERTRYPSLEHVLEFHRHWVGYGNGNAPVPIAEAFQYADQTIKSGMADAHCHVWEDREFLVQIQELIEGGFLPDLSVAHFEPFYVGTNEFAVLFKTI
jgi:hypothetical protein